VRLYYLARARKWVLFAAVPAIIVAGLVYAYEGRQPKAYQATTQLLVREIQAGTTTGVTTSSTSESSQLASTYAGIIASPVILQKVQKSFPSSYNVASHVVGSTLSTDPNTLQPSEVFGVTVQDTDPRRAVLVADDVAGQFMTYINGVGQGAFNSLLDNYRRQLAAAQRQLNKRPRSQTAQNLVANLSQVITQVRLQQAAGKTVYWWSGAQLPTAPVGPHPSRAAILAGFLALLVCALGVFGYEYFDDSLRGREDVAEVGGAPVLGTIPRFDAKRLGRGLITVEHPRAAAAEAYRLIRTNIQFTHVDEPPRTILVTSTSPREGKTTTISNLAQVFTESGQSVTLIDADLRRPSIDRIFRGSGSQGLTWLLTNEHEDGQVHALPDNPNLSVIASGPTPPNPVDLLNSHRMRSLVEGIRARPGVVLIDSPPVLAGADAAVLSTLVQGIILVVNPSVTKRRGLRRAREAIDAVGGRVIGIVLNGVSSGSGHYYYERYHYGQDSREPSGDGVEAWPVAAGVGVK
jgi:polysaccharide biosynthesis transport protein